MIMNYLLNLEHHTVAIILMCLSLSLFIVAYLNDMTLEHRAYASYIDYKKQLRKSKWSGFWYGVAITALSFSIAALYIFTPEVVITYVGQLIDTAINQA